MTVVVIDPSEIENLAPMPASVVRLAGLVGDPDINVSDIVEVVRLDQALTANVLRLANSIWGRSRTPINSLKEAVVRVGNAQILKIAVGQHLADPMKEACPGYELAEHELWRHSVAAALAAEKMSGFVRQTISKFAFTAALMHDIGKLLVGRHMGATSLAEISHVVENERISYVEAEKRVLGTDHAEVGGSIARHWGFPEPLAEAIAYHHDPKFHPDFVMDTVHIANTVAKVIGVGLGIEQMNLKVSVEAPQRLGMDFKNLESLCATVRDELANAERLFMGEEDGT